MALSHSVACLVTCVALAQAAGSDTWGGVSDETALVQRGVLAPQVLSSDVPKAAMVRAKMRLKANHTKTELEIQYAMKAEKVKEMMQAYWQAKQQMEEAKREAAEAKRLMKEEAERLIAEEAERLAQIEAERQAVLEKRRQAREAAMAKAEELSAAAATEKSILSGIPVTTLADMLFSLPGALANEDFLSTITEAVGDMQRQVKNFLNVTNKKTTVFVSAAQSASDAELAYSMAKFFHETVNRLKSLHKQALLVGLRVKRVMPDALMRSMTPVMTQLSENVVTLRVNASELAKGSLGDACDSVSEIMGNISAYDSQLMTVSSAIKNATAQLEPMMGRVWPDLAANATSFMGNLVSITEMEVAGLQVAAHDIVTKVGPLVTDRVHCTWSGARPRMGLGLVVVVLSLVAGWMTF